MTRAVCSKAARIHRAVKGRSRHANSLRRSVKQEDGLATSGPQIGVGQYASFAHGVAETIWSVSSVCVGALKPK